MKKIDDLFKENLDKHGITYENSYWEDMEKMLDKKEKKPLFYRWKISSVLLLLLFTGFICYMGFKYIVPTTHGSADRLVISAQSGNMDKSGRKLPLSNKFNVPNEDIIDGKNKSIQDKNEFNSQASKHIVKIEKLEKAKTSNKNYMQKENDAMEENSMGLDEPVKDNSIIMSGIGYFEIPELPRELDELNPVKTIQALPKLNSIDSSRSEILKPEKWNYYLMLTVESNGYSRAENFSGQKVNEKTLRSEGYLMQFSAMRKNFGIKSGIGFLQLCERTNYQSISTSYNLDTTYRMINSSFGFTTSGNKISLIKRQIDSTPVQNSTIPDPESLVKFSYIKIPLLLSYKFTQKNFGFYLDVGINATFLIKQRGNYSTFENNQFVVKALKGNTDMSRILCYSHIAIGLQYKIGKSVQMFAGYGLSRSLNSMVHSYNQKPKVNLFSFGLAYQLK